ncbi:hypothetical protein LCGC14_1368910 [marine sediment metagenome]|uniref:Uncharacterized protein n=1 Tax=marine sediment metagenome TaxID=412755 RepID=A0A0F9ML43_9ZZZZ
MADPIETVLQDLGKMRGAAYNDLLRLPAPLPLRNALQVIDGMLGSLETEIRRVQRAVPLPSPQQLDQARDNLITQIAKASPRMVNREIVAQADRALAGLGFDAP